MTSSQPTPHSLFAPYASFLEQTLAQPSLPSSSQRVCLADGTRVEQRAPGVLRIQPAGSGSGQLIISAGLHGNETAPIEVCNDLVSALLAGHWSVRIPTLVIFGNPPAMVAGKRFLDYNLNRLFGGAHHRPELTGFQEAGRAAQLEHEVRGFVSANGSGLPLFHYDLHTAIRDSRREKFALYPFVAGRQLPPQQQQFLLDSDVRTVLYQHRPGSTFASWTATEFAAESFTIELGKARPFGENERARFTAIEQSLQQLMSGHWPTPHAASQKSQAILEEFEVVHEIINSGEDFIFHIADDVANFTPYPPGTLIWEDRNNQYRVGPRPECIVFPNPGVPVGQRVGLMVAALVP